ncbi:MAG: DUF814 domain-containing protein [Candidatus Diapherotrites archaeon]|nr:DUF814 domain-containing protein [Candidatus Diapherotrites archaeon]
MKLTVFLNKSVAENAEEYFSRSKKARKKLSGLNDAMPLLEKKLSGVESKKVSVAKKIKLKKKRNWFEKFHWTYSRNGFLIIAGKDAKTNELIVKKHMDENDLYFHSDIHGAPHTVIKSSDKKFSESDLMDAAVFAAVYSRAWKEKLSSLDVYSVTPSQVSKSAPTGEAIGTGAFMIYGKRNWFRKMPLKFALGFNGEELIAGFFDSVKAQCSDLIEVVQGDKKKGEVARKIFFFFKKKGFEFELDEIVSLLPSGGVDVNE